MHEDADRIGILTGDGDCFVSLTFPSWAGADEKAVIKAEAVSLQTSSINYMPGSCKKARMASANSFGFRRGREVMPPSTITILLRGIRFLAGSSD